MRANSLQKHLETSFVGGSLVDAECGWHGCHGHVWCPRRHAYDATASHGSTSNDATADDATADDAAAYDAAADDAAAYDATAYDAIALNAATNVWTASNAATNVWTASNAATNVWIAADGWSANAATDDGTTPTDVTTLDDGWLADATIAWIATILSPVLKVQRVQLPRKRDKHNDRIN